jgi:hypothetical protein
MEDNNKEFEILKAAVNYADNWFVMEDTNNFKALRQGFIAGARWATKEELSEGFSSEDMILYGVWLQENDTEVNGYKWFGYTNFDMLNYWKENHRGK